MHRNDGTCWVLIAHMNVDQLQTTVHRYFQQTGAAEGSTGPNVEVTAGVGEWSIALSRNSDHDGLEGPIARDVSRGTSQPVFVLPYCDEDHGAPGAHEYRDGDEVDVHDVDYDSFLRTHGCSLPPDIPYNLQHLSRYRSVVVFDGAKDPRQILAYLERGFPERAPLDFEFTRAGYPMLRWTGVAPWPGLAEDIDDPSLAIVKASHDLRTGAVAIDLYAAGCIRGLRTVPPGEDPDSYIPSIKGATTPEGVIDALGIPREALGLT